MKRKTFHFLTTASDNNSAQSTVPARVTIPRTINIGGQEFSVADNPELANLVSLVRQDASAVEKAKLYPAIDKLRKEVEVLTTAEIINPTGNADTKGVENLISTIIENKFQGIVNMLEEKLTPLLEASQKSEAATLEAYRKELLDANIGNCVPELVVGNSKEELDQALQVSISSFNSLKDQFGLKSVEEQLANTQHTTPTATPAPATPATQVATPAPATTSTTPKPEEAAPTTIVLPSAPASTEVPGTEIPNIKGMSMEEFAKRREELAKNLASIAQS
jgi:hypothetical protein